MTVASGLICGAPCSHAHNPQKYAAASRLASGQWARIEVEGTGMHFVSNSMISSLGLDPAKINVYGYGGRQIPDCLAEAEPDDLPLIPSVKVNGGIIFFGTDNVSWKANADNTAMTYSHVNHPYAETSYYFLSDIDLNVNDKQEPAAPALSYAPMSGVTPADWFRARIVHEQDVFAPSVMGRILLGEDFRASASQNFRFALPGNRGGDSNVTTRIVFGANVSGGNVSLMFTADGQRLPSTSSDVVSSVSTDSQFLRTANTVKTIPDAGESFQLGITASASGTVSVAALDYIEVEYDRNLTLGTSPYLHFYGNNAGNATYRLRGASQDTRIWDVTDPSRPVEIDFALQGEAATFTDRTPGLREYVAFNPSASWTAEGVKKSSRVANQNIHALPNPDMIIIAPSSYRSQAESVAALHREHDGMTVHVFTPAELYNEFSSGNPDVGAFRKALKMWGDRADADASLPFPAYCLIIGKATNDNKQVTAALKREGYPIVPIWQSPEGFSETSAYSTDDYIGMTEDSDTYFSVASAKIRTAVGRWPVKSEEEASTLVEKLSEYLLNPDLGPWRNNVMLIADDQDNGEHLRQMEDVYSGMISTGNGPAFVYEKLYLDSYPLVATATGYQYPAAKERMLRKWNDGVGWIQYIGHAAIKSWSHEQLLTWLDINSLSNQRLPFLYAATCHFAHHDSPEQSGAEVLLLNPIGGIIGTICPTRTVYISSNGRLTKATSKFIYGSRPDGTPNRVGDVYRLGKNALNGTDDNKLRFALLSDPALPVPTPGLKAVVDKMAEVDIVDGTPADELVIGARKRFTVSGHIADTQGNVCSDFNGQIYSNLFDAEKVVTTFGNGKEGKVENYNDRSTLLFQGAAKVKDGRWEMTVLMPAEIENNYSPAMLSLYANSDSGKEANGALDSFYVYGYDESAPADTDAPQIQLFTLNNELFRPGDVTHSSPVVLATFVDESGISISEAGIGHSISLTLDGKQHFNDVAQFYEPSSENCFTGHIAYPLSGLEPGEHELTLTVWDNAANSTSMSLPFKVGLNQQIDLVTLSSDASPAHDKTVFTLTTDRLLSSMSYDIEVFDLSGRPVWSSGRSSRTRNDGTLRHTWYLTDQNGERVPRGIYLCRATVESEEGMAVSKTIKIAVAAQ